MRFLAIFAVFWAACAGASAQETRSVGDLSPFRIGMSADELRAAEPATRWREHQAPSFNPPPGYFVLVLETPRRFADLPFSGVAEFRDERVDTLRLFFGERVASGARCADVTYAVMRRFENVVGVFDGDAVPGEQVGAPVIRTTPAGSHMRVYEGAEGVYIHANVRRGGLLELSGAYDPQASGGAPSCTISVVITGQAGEARTMAPPSSEDLAAAELIENMRWQQRAGGGDFVRNYPRIAMQHNINGRAVVECLVQEDYRVRCAVIEETPAEYGFGAAARAIVEQGFRAAPDVDGVPTVGKRVRVPIRFAIG